MHGLFLNYVYTRKSWDDFQAICGYLWLCLYWLYFYYACALRIIYYNTIYLLNLIEYGMCRINDSLHKDYHKTFLQFLHHLPYYLLFSVKSCCKIENCIFYYYVNLHYFQIMVTQKKKILSTVMDNWFLCLYYFNSYLTY